jgi:hypothetical protein
MRINPSTSLTGAIQITPGTQGTDTYANVLTQRLVSPEIVDLLPFSETLAKYVGKQEAEAKAITAQEVEAIGRRVQSGDKIEDIMKEYAESGFTPNRVKSKIAAVFNENGLDPAANPAYVQRFREGQADIKALVLRRELLSQKQIEEIAEAGIKDKSGNPYQAMLGALQTKLAGANIYEGLEGIGSSALNARMLGITQDAMEAADERYREKVRQGSAEGFGASLLLSAEEFIAGHSRKDDGLQDMAVSTIERLYMEQRLSGEPEARKLLTDSLIQIAREKGADNPLAAAEFLDRMIGMKEGDADIYEGDLEGRAKLAVEEQRMRDHAKSQLAEKDYTDSVRRKEVFSELNSTFREELLYSTRVGPEAVQKFFQENQEKAVGMFTTEEDKNAAADWWREQLQTSNAVSKTLDSSKTAVNAVRHELNFGNTDRADQLLQSYMSDGVIGTEDAIELSHEVANRRDNLFVYNIPDVKQFSQRVYDEILKSGAFTTEDGQPDSGKILAATRQANTEFQADLTEYLKSPAYTELTTLAEKDIAVQKWIGDQYDKLVGTLLPDTASDVAERPLKESVEVEASRKRMSSVSMKDFRGSAPASLGPVRLEDGPETAKRIGDMLREQKYADGYYNLLDTPSASNTTSAVSKEGRKASARGLRYVQEVVDLATSPDVEDANGKPLGSYHRSQAVAAAMAYGGLLSIDDLISINTTAKITPKSQEKWDFNGISAADYVDTGGLIMDPKRVGKNTTFAWEVTNKLGKYLSSEVFSLRNVDPLRVRLPEVGQLILNVTKDSDGQIKGVKKNSEDKEAIEKVRSFLGSMDLADDDASVGLYIYHQYELTKAQSTTAQ